MISASRIVLVLLAALAGAAAQAAELKPFVAGSMQQIRAAHAGRPFVLALWSLTCSHCQEELAQLGALQRRHPQLNVVLISTDTAEDAEALTATLARHGLARAEAWVYADAFAERLRFEIDPRWGGELPRTYLFDRAHAVTARSGALAPAELERWAVMSLAPKATP
ncbi:MAG TPA: TlpA disulfide reductase family protein [Acidiferrobacterales bacterium]|nr:TlpA disulfide reductase family protein [Acidiferrobacterales bacterium]